MRNSEPWGAFSPGDETDEEIILWIRDETDENIVAQRSFSAESLGDFIDTLNELLG